MVPSEGSDELARLRGRLLKGLAALAVSRPAEHQDWPLLSSPVESSGAQVGVTCLRIMDE